MWIEEIAALYPAAEFGAPAAPARLDEADRRLGTPVPDELRELLLESDGVRDDLLIGVIWPISRIEADNIEFRGREDFKTLYAPFDPWLFFGDNGGGDQFALAVHTPDPAVWVWEHETDTRRKVADDLHDYLARRLPADGDDWYVDWPE